MTDEERKKYSEMPTDDLLDVIDALTKRAEMSESAFAKERKKMIAELMRPSAKEDDEGAGDDDDALDIKNNAAFEKLKKKFRR